jgi:hypothetical protein
MGTVGTVYLMRFFKVCFHEFNSIYCIGRRAPLKETEDVIFLIVRRTLEMFQRFHDYMST